MRWEKFCLIFLFITKFSNLICYIYLDINNSFKMATLKDREANFAEAFNKTIGGIVQRSNQTSRPEQYYENLDIAQIIELKKTLSTVNNIITLKAAQSFVWKLGIDLKVKEDIDAEINQQSGNENGYDIRWDADDFKFIAEVKCNIPADGDKFGPEQLRGIYKDIVYLSNGKTKETNCNPDGYYKFMIFLNCDNITPAIDALKGKTPKSTNYNIKDMGLSDEEIGSIWGKLELWDWNIQQLDRNKIYICVVDIQK